MDWWIYWGNSRAEVDRGMRSYLKNQACTTQPALLFPLQLLTISTSTMSTLNASFEEAIRVTPEGNNKYSATLRPEWCIGAGISRLIPANFQAHPWLIILIVPHGGYTTSVLYRLALVHFAHAHPNKYSTPASPISLQLSFLRRTLAGPATMEVEDVKLGARTSTIHIKLLQPSEKKPNESEIKVAGYITVSPPDAEIGITASTGWKPHPTPPIGSGPGGEINFSALASKGSDGRWIKLEPPFPEFRRAAAQLELYGPGKGDEQQKETGSMAIDQWARFRPNGDVNGRWTDAAIPYLIDMFPMALDGFDTVSANATAKEQGKGGASEGDKAKFWYPTVTLNVDMKKHLPVEGVEWLYSRIVTKVVRDGRTDLDVTVLDQNGDVIALSTQVGLVVSASRNLGTRKMQKL